MNTSTRVLITTAALLLAGPAIASDIQPTSGRVEVQGPHGEWHKLTRVSAEVAVDVSPEEAWAMLADFGGVQDYLDSIYESDWIGEPVLDDDAARYCRILFGGRDILVKERIFELTDGESFVYDVYDWENFPLNRMHNEFGVTVNEAGETVVYNVIDFKLKPAFLTGLLKGQMRDSARASLLGVKHWLETGEGDKTRAQLEAMYPAA